MSKPALITATFCLIFLTSLGQSQKFIYTSPQPDAKYINPEQNIILRTAYPLDKASLKKTPLSIEGTISGIHSYNILWSEDLKTFIIRPDEHFYYGEKVTINIGRGLNTSQGNTIENLSFSFTIKPQDNLPLLKAFYQENYNDLDSGLTLPNAHLPLINFSRDNYYPTDYQVPHMIHFDDLDDDHYFFTFNPRGGSSDYSDYLSINDKFGIPLFFRKTKSNNLNFHVMPSGWLAYARNDYANPKNEKYFILDSAFVCIDSVAAGNGYNLDAHDLLCLENGHYLILSYDPQPVDMSEVIIGGNPNATVIGLVIQEVDNEENVYFQWRSWDHFQITDATDDIDLLASNIDYVHGNALELDMDGNLLLSSRHLDEITKIDIETGDMIYRFGLLSKNNQFTISNDPDGFSHQHDVRVLENGNITIYDNGNLHPTQFSQAVEYSIDENTMTANREWFYKDNPTVFGPATGSYRRYDNDFNLIGWGSTVPLAATAIKTDQSKVLEIYLDGTSSYRVLKYPWETSLFKAPPVEDMGNFYGHSQPKQILLPIWNTADHPISVTSAYNHSQEFGVLDNLPKLIPAGDTITLSLYFDPSGYGEFSDILTLNYDRYTLSEAERIARQITLLGTTDSTSPRAQFNPAYGTQDVDPDEAIQILFSEPVRKIGGSDIHNEDIPLLFEFKTDHEWGQDVAFDGLISADSKEILLKPAEILDEEQQYFVRLKPMVLEGMQANAISHTKTCIFTTGLITRYAEDTAPEGIKVYPNPFTDQILLDSGKEFIQKATVYHSTGKMIAEINIGTQTGVIPTVNYPSGTYFIAVRLASGLVESFKVVKIE